MTAIGETNAENAKVRGMELDKPLVAQYDLTCRRLSLSDES